MQQHYQTLQAMADRASIASTEWEWFVNTTSVKSIASGVEIIQSDDPVHQIYEDQRCNYGLGKCISIL